MHDSRVIEIPGGGGVTRSASSARRSPLRTVAILILATGAFVVLMCGSWLVYSLDTRVREALASSETKVDALNQRVSTLISEKNALHQQLKALQHDVNTGVDHVAKAAAVASEGIREVKQHVNKLQAQAEVRIDQRIDQNISEVKRDVNEVRSHVNSMESSLKKIREKMAQTPAPIAEQDYRDRMQQFNGGVSPQQPQQPPHEQQQPPEPDPQPTAPGIGQRRDTPKLSREFDDIENPVERNRMRRDKIRSEFEFSYGAYKTYAWGRDELRPLSFTYKNWVRSSKGIALTIFDALTTMALMNMTRDLHTSIEYILESVDFDQDMRISAFEATIRIVAGLLSTYELTGEKDRRLVDLAAKVMDRLLWAYNTSTGIPNSQVNLRTHKHWCPDWTSGGGVLSEFASIQLELRTLSYHTGNPLYDMKATHIMDIVESVCETQDFLCPTFIDTATGVFRDDHITFGALGDSFYEYLVKQYLLTGRTEPRYRNMAIKALKAASLRLVRYSEPSRQAFIAEFNEGAIDPKMDELACFAGGMFALAAMEIPDNGAPLEFRRVAEELTTTCYQMWAYQRTGIAPESVVFPNGGDFTNGPTQYLLRPETLESLFYVWRMTKNETYREWAWDLFTSIYTYCRVPTGGYTGITAIDIIPPEPDNLMQSFFLAETLKYLYLIFSDDSLLPLNEWVLNTAAHPLKIRRRDPLKVWTDWEEKHGSLPWDPPTVDRVSIHTETAKQKAVRKAHPDRIVVAPADPLAVEEPDPDEEINALEAAGQTFAQPPADKYPGDTLEAKRSHAKVTDAPLPDTTASANNQAETAEGKPQEDASNVETPSTDAPVALATDAPAALGSGSGAGRDETSPAPTATEVNASNGSGSGSVVPQTPDAAVAEG